MSLWNMLHYIVSTKQCLQKISYERIHLYITIAVQQIQMMASPVLDDIVYPKYLMIIEKICQYVYIYIFIIYRNMCAGENV